MRINLNKKYLPANDVVFSIMFESIPMFTNLLDAVTGDKHNIVSVVSQASRYNENVDEKTIRFDTRGVDINGKIFTLDMQRSYLVVRHKKRTVYYGCREIAKQTVVDFRYEDLVSVSVAFVITNRGNRKVEKIQLKSENGEIYTDLLTLYNVYLPKEMDSRTGNSDLDIYIDFFSIKSKSSAKKFERKYTNNTLATTLIRAYNRAIGVPNLGEIAQGGHFMFKATQADYDRQKAEGRAEGRDEGRKAERKKNIKNAVAELKKELKSKEAVTDMVMRIFQLDEQTAAKKVAEYWKK